MTLLAAVGVGVGVSVLCIACGRYVRPHLHLPEPWRTVVLAVPLVMLVVGGAALIQAVNLADPLDTLEPERFLPYTTTIIVVAGLSALANKSRA